MRKRGRFFKCKFKEYNYVQKISHNGREPGNEANHFKVIRKCTSYIIHLMTLHCTTGVVHLEALELLSKEYDAKVHMYMVAQW